MNVIVNLRGTSGAGKSTVAHTLLKKYPHEVVESAKRPRGDRPLVYRINVQGTAPIFLFGAYHTQCGGCDGIMDYGNVLPPLLRRYASQGHILFEGLLISGGVGRVGQAMQELDRSGRSRAIWALLDTPLELCLERIEARRRARGVDKPLNPANTAQKHRAAQLTHAKLYQEGWDSRLIDHRKPVKSVLKLFGIELAKEPAHASAQ